MKRILIAVLLLAPFAGVFSQERDTLDIVGGRIIFRGNSGMQAIAPINYVRYGTDGSVFVGNQTSVIRFNLVNVTIFTVEGSSATVSRTSILDSIKTHLNRAPATSLYLPRYNIRRNHLILLRRSLFDDRSFRRNQCS